SLFLASGVGGCCGNLVRWIVGVVELLVGDKDVTVANMYRLGWDLGGNGWRWRRRLFAWEEQMWGGCCTIVANVVLQVDSSNEWGGCPIMIQIIQ
ncbi:YIPF1-like protein, partial [Trifolium medium]|nr:YIPF1-like protein [Trifolium medium]